MLSRQRITDTLGVYIDGITTNKELLEQERWHAILKCNQEFLQNKDHDPCRHPYMDQEVGASWIRSRDLGVDPYTIVTRPNLCPNELSEILEKNRILIDITYDLITFFKELMFSCGYIVYLVDKNGVVLLNEGMGGQSPLIFEHDSRRGIVIDENSEGTTAHELCIRLKRPVQLMGPEHYCIAFQNRIASSAPIKDETDEVYAALVLLSQPLLHPPEEETLKNMCLHSLGLTTSMALALEVQLKLQKMNRDFCDANQKVEAFNSHLQMAKEKLVIVNNTLDTTSAFIDEGILAIDRTGKIVHSNQEGMRILKLKIEEIGNRNISEFLSEDFHIMELAEKGDNITVDERICVDNDEQSYQVSIRPILNQFTAKLDVVVLKISSVPKVATRLTNRSGNMGSYTFEDIISKNKEFKKIIDVAQRFASTSENILLMGESGTGKELFAQAIHNIYRPQGPFVAVNCAAMPHELIQSELFGYEGGSFTGAERNGRIGKIEMAHGGTLFLDEIGDMPLEIQAVLLRILEDKQVMRVGGRRYKKVDFRLITATNKDLYKMGKENQFREDLYFRLSVLNVMIPPLRERGNDAEIISKIFIENYCQKLNLKIPQISGATQTLINEYAWPGNVRQLKNAMIYAINTAQGGIIKPENLPSHVILDICPKTIDELTNGDGKMSQMLRLDNLEKSAIEKALLYVDNAVPAAAEILGISRSTLYRKLKDYNIEY